LWNCCRVAKGTRSGACGDDKAELARKFGGHGLLIILGIALTQRRVAPALSTPRRPSTSDLPSPPVPSQQIISVRWPAPPWLQASGARPFTNNRGFQPDLPCIFHRWPSPATPQCRTMP
jgi:hypothetical protein